MPLIEMKTIWYLSAVEFDAIPLFVSFLIRSMFKLPLVKMIIAAT